MVSPSSWVCSRTFVEGGFEVEVVGSLPGTADELIQGPVDVGVIDLHAEGFRFGAHEMHVREFGHGADRERRKLRLRVAGIAGVARGRRLGDLASKLELAQGQVVGVARRWNRLAVDRGHGLRWPYHELAVKRHADERSHNRQDEGRGNGHNFGGRGGALGAS